MMKLCSFSRSGAFAAVLIAVAVSPARAADHTVNIVGDSFSPSTLTINAGDTVSWSGLGGNHNVTGSSASDLSDFCGPGLNSFGTETSCSHTFMTAGTFPYECTIHASCCGMVGSITVNAVAPPPKPTVSITNPVNGAVFAAPLNLPMAADASVSSGTVTNVVFLNGSTVLGAVTAPPFSVTADGLGAGSYALTAVATAGGISTTSAVVHVTVVTPSATDTMIVSPGIADGQFSFTFAATSGLTYAVQSSPDLVNWSTVATITASSSSAPFSDSFQPTASAYYRVVRQPNP